MGWGAKQGEPHDRAPEVVPVLAVIEQGYAVARLPKVSPAVGAHLELRLFPAGVGVRTPLDVSELDLVSRAGRPHGNRKCHLEEPVLLTPVHLGLEAQHARTGVHDHPLFESRATEVANESDRRAK